MPRNQEQEDQNRNYGATSPLLSRRSTSPATTATVAGCHDNLRKATTNAATGTGTFLSSASCKRDLLASLAFKKQASSPANASPTQADTGRGDWYDRFDPEKAAGAACRHLRSFDLAPLALKAC